ncbi:MAG: ATP-dependent zinc metalloprotease FtsH [Planctomycetota bacterium]|nr:ATP-dependent zinc metalloprotease FtsH [Planctomycetota bacterium]
MPVNSTDESALNSRAQSDPPVQPASGAPRDLPESVPNTWRAGPPPEGAGPRTPRRPTAEGSRGGPFGPWMFLVMGALTLCVFSMYFVPIGPARVNYSFFRDQVAKKNVESLQFARERITGEWRELPESEEHPGQKLAKKFTTILPPVEDQELIPDLRKSDVKFVSDPTNWADGLNLFISLLGFVLMLGLIWIVLRRSGDPMGTGSMVSNFIRRPAKRFLPADQQNTFADVAGMEQAKCELQEVVEFLKSPAKFQKLGAQIPKGVLLMGPPGTGKTLLARATAGEAGVPFYSINGSEFIQMFVGVGASRVRDMFRTAKESSPCILFIDEIDAVGRIRGAGVGGGHDEREQTLNQILSEMDGFTPSEAVIILAATNRPDVLDPALLRPGRFDRHVTIDRPTREGRVGILKVHTRKVPLDDTVNLEVIAGGTIGFSGADLRNLVNEAALMAARENKSKVGAADFDTAKDKVLMGPKREEVLNQHEREMTAYHEAGHALIAWLLPELDAVHKVTIVTQLVPEEERYHMGELRLHSHLAMAMGGRAAEKLVFDEFSAGAESDIKQATSIARRMVAHWGMSEIIGPVAFHQSEEHPFLGKEIHETRNFSEETAHTIDQEVQRFVNDASARALKILEANRGQLKALADALLKNEEISKDQVAEILGPRPLLTHISPN